MHEIYSGKTFNDVNIRNMTDIEFDCIYNIGYYFLEDSKSDACFVRLSGWYDSEDMSGEAKPALTVFSHSNPSVPLYAMKLKGKFSDYYSHESGYDDYVLRPLVKKISSEFREYIVAVAEARLYEKEREVWEHIFDDCGDNSPENGKEFAWLYNGCDKMNSEDLHIHNLNLVRYSLNNEFDGDADKLLDKQGYLSSYVAEIKGHAEYLAAISGSDQGLSGQIRKLNLNRVSDRELSFRQDSGFVSENEDTFREKVRAFYDRDTAIKWLSEQGYGPESLGYQDFTVSGSLLRKPSVEREPADDLMVSGGNEFSEQKGV